MCGPLNSGLTLAGVGLLGAALLAGCATPQETLTMQAPVGQQRVSIPKSGWTGAASGAQSDALAKTVVQANNNYLSRDSRGRTVILVSIGSASAVGNPQFKRTPLRPSTPPSAYNAGVASGAAIASAPASGAYVMGANYVTLPAGSVSINKNGTMYYLCGNTWFQPSYGAHGVMYRVMPAP